MAAFLIASVFINEANVLHLVLIKKNDCFIKHTVSVVLFFALIIVGAWPTLNSFQPLLDSDSDGMPDVWEESNGLNAKDSADRNKDLDADGFTELEEYLNSLVPYEGLHLYF